MLDICTYDHRTSLAFCQIRNDLMLVLNSNRMEHLLPKPCIHVMAISTPIHCHLATQHIVCNFIPDGNNHSQQRSNTIATQPHHYTATEYTPLRHTPSAQRGCLHQYRFATLLHQYFTVAKFWCLSQATKYNTAQQQPYYMRASTARPFYLNIIGSG
jgi:hypothetical protein